MDIPMIEIKQPQNPDVELSNADLLPTSLEQRHWYITDMASLWVGMVVCIPSYQIAAGLIEQGMNWWQALMTVFFGNLIVLIPMILNGYPGTALGVPFPVIARASFGIHGAHIPSMLRALVACGWFGIQTWIGGFSIYQMLSVFLPSISTLSDLPILGINPMEFLCFLAFWGLQLWILYDGLERIRLLEKLAAPFLILMGLLLLVWAYLKAGGFGAMLSSQGAFGSGGSKEGQFWQVFFPSLTAMVGFWSTLSLNIPDFTRYAKSQKDQVLGQALGLPTTMTLFAFIGIAVTSATTVIFGETIWDPTKLIVKIGGTFSVCLSLFALSIATLSTNIAANVVSPANALINAFPKKIDFSKGAMLTAGLGLVMMPWKLIENTQGYIFTWLIGYSALLGPIGGILISDYFLVKKKQYDIDALFQKDGIYWYQNGFNAIALITFILSVLPNLPGFLFHAGVLEKCPEFFKNLYTYAWFIGFFLSIVLYYCLMMFSKQNLKQKT
jgi:NCS1 family nucleobase:cation symporter-1